jgi:hypothetical protein
MNKKDSILNALEKGFSGKWNLYIGDTDTDSHDNEAVTEQIEHNPYGRPYTYYYGWAFASYRHLANNILHEFEHIDNILSRNFGKDMNRFSSYTSRCGIANK